MNEHVLSMLDRYDIVTQEDATRALREIIQEIALAGLFRGKFFTKAAFYGGTALRILYRLDRFSEDMDFSLLAPDSNFSLEPYHHFIVAELNSYGFDVEISTKDKKQNTSIESAFIKANTLNHLLKIDTVKYKNIGISNNQTLKIKFEIDIDPPLGFSTEAKFIKEPIPVSINCFVPSDLFAGKMHAVLCRSWGNRVKGRDWYDFVWYVRKNIPLNLHYLQSTMLNSQHINAHTKFDKETFLELFDAKLNELDIELAKNDIIPFVKDRSAIDCWTKPYFKQIVNEISIL